MEGQSNMMGGRFEAKNGLVVWSYSSFMVIILYHANRCSGFFFSPLKLFHSPPPPPPHTHTRSHDQYFSLPIDKMGFPY